MVIVVEKFNEFDVEEFGGRVFLEVINVEVSRQEEFESDIDAAEMHFIFAKFAVDDDRFIDVD